VANSTANRVKKKIIFDQIKCRGYAPCSYCGKKLTFAQATLDHVFPQSLGGHSGLGNLVIACEKCNKKKGSYDWRGKVKDTQPDHYYLVELIESLSQPRDERTS
jgi:5-methylcytosine-specific restriction endonuclease McrA